MGDIIDSEYEGEVNSQSAIAFNIPDLKAMAAKILRRANDVAQQKIAAAQKSVEDLEKKARSEGQTKGYNEGLKKAEAEGRNIGEKAAREEFQQATSPVAAALQMAINGLNQKKQTLQADAEADLLRLAIEIARRVVRREVAIDPEFVVPQVREAIALTNNRSDLIIWLHPDDRGAVEREIPTLKAIFSDIGRVELREDSEVERGGARVTGRDGEVDLQLKTQLESLEMALLGDTDGLSLVPQMSEPHRHAPRSAAPSPAGENAAPAAEEKVVAQPEDSSAPAKEEVRPVAESPAPEEKQDSVESEPSLQPEKPARPARPAKSGKKDAPAADKKTEEAAPKDDAAGKKPEAGGQNPVVEDAGGFVEGVVDEAAHKESSALSGIGSLNDIPVDPEMEKLMEQVLREG